METEKTKTTPILEIAWMRYAQLNASAMRRTNAYKRLRVGIATLGVVATLLSILAASDLLASAPLLGVIIKNLFIITPIVASLLAAFGTRTFANGDWLVTRAAAEEYLKEIYFFRTILRGNKDRRAYLEKRINEIQKQIYRGLGGEFAFRPYQGPIPPYYNPEYGNDPGFNDLNGEQYFKYRLEDQLRWHIREINEWKRERAILTFLVLAVGGLGTYFAALGGSEYIKSMQEALKDSDLEKEASLVNRVIKESVESAERTKQAMADNLVEFSQETLQGTERQVQETFEVALGALAEEASSELVQKELEAMSKAVTETVENAMERGSALTSSLAQIAQEFAHIDIGRDTTKEELNAILARYPKTGEVKG